MTHIKIIDSKISILVVLILIFSNQTFSQSFKKQLRKADESFYDEDYENAYQGYNKLSEEFPSEKSVFRYQELLAYHLSTGKGTDINELKSFQKKKGATDEFYNYFMGRIYILRYDFDKAIRHLEAFLKMDVYISKQLFQETEELLKWAQEAKVFYENIDEYELYPLPESVNTEYSEVAPTFFKGHNELIFFRSTDKFSDSFHAYHAIKTEDKWSDISKINVFGEFNNYETRAEILANDNRLLFFKQENGGDLFASRYEENAGWTAPIEYDESLRTRISSDFFMNNDETLILYSSFEGDNQFNIYKIFKTGNTWSEPELLNFNTEQYDEDFPYLSDDEKTLYFSSNRPESIGGYDVFKVLWDESQGNWSEPINLGFPINTIDNEFQFQISHGTNTGYFSSNRLHGKGLYDIYYFFEIEKQKITGRVTNILDNLPLSDITIKFHPIEYTDESIVGSTDSNGEFSINLISNETFKVEFFKSDVLFATKEATIKKTQTNQNFKIEIPDNILSNANLETLYTGSSEKVIPIEMLGNKFRTGKKTVIQNIYFDFQSDNLTAESEPVLETLRRTLSKYPKTNIQIAGFTDNVGSHSYNIGLSLNRANSVKAYLVQKGITASRLQTKGFGELNPLASNDDEKDGRELNRRIEITLIE